MMKNVSDNINKDEVYTYELLCMRYKYCMVNATMKYRKQWLYDILLLQLLLFEENYYTEFQPNSQSNYCQQ